MPKRTYVYIAIAGEDQILGGVLDPETGIIDSMHQTPIQWGPETMVVDPGKRFLFVGCYPRYYPKDYKSKLYSYRIDHETGALLPINDVCLDFAPTYLSVDRKSNYLLTAYYRSGKASVHRLCAGGEIGEATQWFDSGGGAHCIQVDRSNQFAYLPHITASRININHWPPAISPNHILPSASNIILQFKFDEVNGTFTPNSPFKLPGERGGGPRHYCFHPRLNLVYFANEQGCSVTVYAMNPVDGTLAPIQNISTLPLEGFDDYASCSSLRLTSSSRYLYVLNRGFNAVTCYIVDPVTGRLRINGWVKTEEQPHTLEIDPDDRFLFVAGHQSGQLATYRIGEDGKLDQIGCRPIGTYPKWIVAVRQD